MTASSWAAALDALEERLRRQADVVAGRSQIAPTGGLPVVDGPIPPELVDRARALLERTNELEGEATTALGELRRRMQQRSGGGVSSPYGRSAGPRRSAGRAL